MLPQYPRPFVTLFLGRLGEESFLKDAEQTLPIAEGFRIERVAEDRRYGATDIEIQRGEVTLLRANVKVHATQFKKAKSFVGLDPEDCFALALYKILNGIKLERSTEIPFVFIVYVNWNVGETLQRDLYNKLRNTPMHEEINTLFSRRRRNRTEEDQLIDRVITYLKSINVWDEYVQLIRASNKRVISAEKGLNLVIEHLDSRIPTLKSSYLARRILTGGGEVDMHFSISEEMTDMWLFLQAIRCCKTPLCVKEIIANLNV